MDRRDAMYFLNRGSGAGTQQQQPQPPELQWMAPLQLPGIQMMPNPSGGANILVQPSGNAPVHFLGESTQAVPTQSGATGVRFRDGGSQNEPVEKKRGRPRKFDTDVGGSGVGSKPLAPSPISSASPIFGSGKLPRPGSSPGSGATSRARGQGRGRGRGRGRGWGRGRPRGTGSKQRLASMGHWFANTAGTGFKPHIITIDVGEDITSRIMSFSRQGPRAICILSANGAVSSVTLRQPAISARTITYDGYFQILSLSGSIIPTDNRTRSGGLSISFSNLDGKVIGGSVGGFVLASSPVQVIVGSFSYNGSEGKDKKKTRRPSTSSPPPDVASQEPTRLAT